MSEIKILCETDSAHEETVKKAKEAMLSPEIIGEVSARFKVLGEPSRLKILTVLMQGELCVYHICEATGAMQSATSHQLRILRDNKFIKSRREGKTVLYSIADEHIASIIEAAVRHAGC